MILSDRLESFLESFDTGLPPQLEELEKTCREQGLPVIRPQTQALLRTLMALKAPRRLLEIGTCTGFSTLLLCEYGSDDLEVVTMESLPARAAAAAQTFIRFGRDRQITLLEGDASILLKDLKETFDMIFLDAAKGQYIHWLPDLLRLMGSGSILVSDNVLQDGNLLESHVLVERRDRTIYHRMREYLFAITHDPSLTTSILPVGDGVSLSVRK